MKNFSQCSVLVVFFFFSSVCFAWGTDYFSCGNRQFIGINSIGCITEGAFDYCPGNSGTPWVKRIFVDSSRARLETVQKVMVADGRGGRKVQEYLRIWELERESGRFSEARVLMPVVKPDEVILKYRETCEYVSALGYWKALFKAMMRE